MLGLARSEVREALVAAGQGHRGATGQPRAGRRPPPAGRGDADQVADVDQQVDGRQGAVLGQAPRSASAAADGRSGPRQRPGTAPRAARLGSSESGPRGSWFARRPAPRRSGPPGVSGEGPFPRPDGVDNPALDRRITLMIAASYGSSASTNRTRGDQSEGGTHRSEHRKGRRGARRPCGLRVAAYSQPLTIPWLLVRFTPLRQ